MPNAILRGNKAFEPLTDAIAARFGWQIDQQVYLRNLNFASFTVPPGAQTDTNLQALRQEFAAYIQYAAYSPLMQACWDPDDDLYTQSTQTTGPQWSLKKSRFNEVWDTTKGSASVRVAIVDTGCYLDHVELIGQVLTPADFPAENLDIANNDSTMEDNVDHGTFLCGLVSALADEGFGMAGAAPDCRVIPIKISEAGEANHARFVAGCMLGFTLGAKVVNLSWRSTVGSAPLEEMVDDIYNGGGLLFVSAANDGTDDMTWPAAYENAVAVGNSRTDDSRVPSSTYGDWVDIAAPGEDLKSTGNHFADEHHGPWTGTSFSAPLTAAAAALLWSYKPELTNAEIRILLETTGAPTIGFNPSNSIKRLDVAAALEAIVPDPVPIPTIDSVTTWQTLLGTISKVSNLDFFVTNPQDIGFIRYTLDCLPLGVADPTDMTQDVTAGGIYMSWFTLDSTPRLNQQAVLRAQCFDTDGNPGMEATTPVFIFNIRGDVNSDGKIDAADTSAYIGMGGLKSGDAGYIPYFDSDLDGTITEADAGVIGYDWNP
ncbi:MAG: S8 family serine peptidase [bacterium]|nr:S8 family serine peptidase [bacterium]